MSQFPVKFRIAQTVYQNKELSNREILKILRSEYPFDRSISENGMEEYLLSLKAVGIIEETRAAIDLDGKLIMFYKTTNYGVSCMKYMV